MLVTIDARPRSFHRGLCFWRSPRSMTLPLPARLSTRIPGDSGDPILNIRLLSRERVRDGQSANDGGKALCSCRSGDRPARSKYSAGAGGVTAPRQLASYNIAFKLPFALSVS